MNPNCKCGGRRQPVWENEKKIAFKCPKCKRWAYQRKRRGNKPRRRYTRVHTSRDAVAWEPV